MIDIKQDLITARNYKQEGRYEEALKYFKKAYDVNPDAFKESQKDDYAWTIYRAQVQNFKNEDELLESAQLITEIVSQKDLTKNSNCPYTSAIFKVLNHYYNNDYYSMVVWLEKLDYTLLDEKPYTKYGRLNKSKKEKYLDWASTAYLKTMEFEKCIEISNIALNTFETFLDEGDAWFKWRIAKSLMGLNQFSDALEYYLEVIEVKHEWYMYRDIAEIYYCFKKPYIALDYICPAVLSQVDNLTKMNLYLLCYNVFKSFNKEMALKHAQLFYLLRKEMGYSIPSEIEKLGIDETIINKKELENEIRILWTQYKFKDQKQHYGTIIKFNPDENHGEIKSEKDESILFNKNQLVDDNVFVGQKVSFYLEEQVYNKVKSLKAVFIRKE